MLICWWKFSDVSEVEQHVPPHLLVAHTWATDYSASGLWVGLCSRVLDGAAHAHLLIQPTEQCRAVSLPQPSQTSWLTATVMSFDSEPSGVSPPVAGVLIAVISSFINGSTFVLQKKGILRSRDRGSLSQRGKTSQRDINTEAIKP